MAKSDKLRRCLLFFAFGAFAMMGAMGGITCAYSAPLASYDIIIKDGEFIPPSLSVPEKQRFKIRISNQGTSPAEFENLSLRVEKVLGPGVSSFVIVPPLKVGEYIFIDEFHPQAPGLKIIVISKGA